MKFPNLNELTDIKKLKELGSNLAESAAHNVSVVLGKVKKEVDQVAHEPAKKGIEGVVEGLNFALQTLQEVLDSQSKLSKDITNLRTQINDIQELVTKSDAFKAKPKVRVKPEVSEATKPLDETHKRHN